MATVAPSAHVTSGVYLLRLRSSSTLAALRPAPKSLLSSSSSNVAGCCLKPSKRTVPFFSSTRLIVRAARMGSGRVSLGFKAPDFELPEPLTGNTWTLQDFDGFPALVVMFICNHCPFVKHLKPGLVNLSKFYMEKGLAVVAISSNSVATHPQDGPELMAEDAKAYGYPFPYLYDETQDVARSFGAVCTPEFFLFKKDGRRPFELVYHGQFDDSRPSNDVPVTGSSFYQGLESCY